jgi:hypothetical protein
LNRFHDRLHRVTKPRQVAPAPNEGLLNGVLGLVDVPEDEAAIRYRWSMTAVIRRSNASRSPSRARTTNSAFVTDPSPHPRSLDWSAINRIGGNDVRMVQN